jgi:hypothetical protein
MRMRHWPRQCGVRELRESGRLLRRGGNVVRRGREHPGGSAAEQHREDDDEGAHDGWPATTREWTRAVSPHIGRTCRERLPFRLGGPSC